MKLEQFGSWTGRAALINPKKYLTSIKQTGVNLLDVMVNDGSKKCPFHIYFNEDKIVESLNVLKQSGINISITTWAQPDETWIKGMEQVARIANRCNIDLITLDLEETWVNPLKNKSDMEIFTWSIALIMSLRRFFKGKIAVAPIVYCNKKVLHHIFELVDIIIPQCYSTVKNVPNNHNIGSLERTSYSSFVGYGKELIMGQAAWNLKGSYGFDKPGDAINASLTATINTGILKVRYWRHENLYGEILDSIKKFL